MKEIKLAEKYKKALDDFTKTMAQIYQYELVSIILYGSAASGEFIDSYSNLNVLVVLKDTSLPKLKLASATINKLNFRRINPIFLTEDYINKSLDVFPIEFFDMKENSLVLTGKDIFQDITIDLKNLRFQCEQELKSKLINFRQQYLRTNQNNKADLINLLFRNFTSVIHILRNIIRLKGKNPSYTKEDVLREIAIELNIGITFLMKLLKIKNSHAMLSLNEIQELMTDFTIELEKIIQRVDTLQL